MRAGLYVARDVAGVRGLLAPLVDRDDWHALAVEEQLGQEARLLLDAHAAGDARIRPIFGSWHPEYVGAAPSKILGAPITLDDCRLAVAREHGFASFDEARGPQDAEFERAVDALVHGELATLTAALDARPDLVTARSRFGHRSTLLHYAGSNGVETWRQVVPSNVVEAATLLIERGADPEARAEMYGGATPLELASTSGHPREAGVQRALEVALGRKDGPRVGAVSLAPILYCASFEDALAVFRDELGFSVSFTWGDPPDFGGVTLGRAQLFLCQGGQGKPGTWVSIFVDDVDAYRDGLKLSRAQVLHGPQDEPWGVRELVVRVHDEHVLRFGSPVL